MDWSGFTLLMGETYIDDVGVNFCRFLWDYISKDSLGFLTARSTPYLSPITAHHFIQQFVNLALSLCTMHDPRETGGYTGAPSLN